MTKAIVDSARLKAKSQITLPKEICETLGISIGDNVTFIAQGDKVFMMNPAIYAMKMMQEAMKGEAEKAGLYTDEDVVKLAKDIRKGRI